MGEKGGEQTKHFSCSKETDNERVLGIVWNPGTDVFSFSTAPQNGMQKYLNLEIRPTKRIVLSYVMGFFDPLGLLSLFTIHGRILVQDLWRTGCKWDDEIGDECMAKWERWIALLPKVETLRIPRCYLGDAHSSTLKSFELHVFTDASEHAYGCVAYFRADFGHQVHCALVMSRSKVAPLKQQSIPRLELMAAVLGARLRKTIEENHTLPICRCVFWCDSRTVLSWIQSDQHNYKQFVSFRIGEILELSVLTEWRWIPTKLNVADVLTKWGREPPMQSNSLWVEGPQFLYQPEESWPTQALPDINTREEMRAYLLFHATAFKEPVINVKITNRWTKLVRIMATVFRFIENCMRKRLKRSIITSKATNRQNSMLKAVYEVIQQPLQQEELHKAEVTLWKMAQHEHFPDEMHTLIKNSKREPNEQPTPIEVSSTLFALTPILDSEGVMRVGGRLMNCKFASFDKKYPIILPQKHDVVKKVIQHYHEQFGHANRETVFNELRQKFYIPKLRAAILQVMQVCVWCRVNRCRPAVPIMAPLPVERVNMYVRPFSAVGVDYLGPLEVSVGRRKEKRWIALFTCLSVRAVHLELVHSLTTQACLMAIRRFICRRGVPECFFSDNGTNFKGARNELRKNLQQIEGECAEEMITAETRWCFNPPGAPHMGGIWERMVRSVKESMKALHDGRKLTDEILLTTLMEAEDMINSRPLTYLPQESAETEALTPNHFLRGAVKEADLAADATVGQAEALRDLYKRSQYLANRMWERWSKEYLPGINRRSKWFEEQKPLRAGDLVFIVDGKNRKGWIRGVVDTVIKSSDGRVRQVDVRTARGLYRRAVANLAVFEIGDSKTGSTSGTTGVTGGGVTTPLGSASVDVTTLPDIAGSTSMSKCDN